MRRQYRMVASDKFVGEWFYRRDLAVWCAEVLHKIVNSTFTYTIEEKDIIGSNL
jgi:hypothetical protein